MEKSTRLSRASRRDCFVSRGNRQNIMKMCSTIDVPADRQAACIVGLSCSLSVRLSAHLSLFLSIYLSISVSDCLAFFALFFACFACRCSRFFFIFPFVSPQHPVKVDSLEHISICHLPLKIDQHFDGLNVKRLLESADSHGPQLEARQCLRRDLNALQNQRKM